MDEHLGIQLSSYSNVISLPFRGEFGGIKALFAKDNKINQLVVNGVSKNSISLPQSLKVVLKR